MITWKNRLAVPAAFVILGASGATAAAQEVLVIDGTPEAAACPVVEELVGTVEGGPDVPLTSREMSLLALDPDGGIWVAPEGARGLLVRYGSDESVPEVRIEARTPVTDLPIFIRSLAWLPGDALSVLGSPGIHLRIEHDGEIRSRSSHPAIDYVGSVQLLSDGSYVMNAQVNAPGSRARSVHLVDSDGMIVQSLPGPPVDAVTLPADQMPYVRSLALTPDETGVWTASRNQYQVTLWSLDGVHVRTLRREVEWFEPWTEATSPAVGPPPPRLGSMATDPEGRLWTQILVADPNFEVRPPADPTAATPHVPVDEVSRQHDAIVEVLEPGSGTVLAHCRFPGPVRLLPGGPWLIRPSITSEGHQRFRIFRVELASDG